MKKITVLAVAALAISFASCKKDRTCTCTTTYSNGDKFVTTYKAKSSKKQGEAWCTAGQNATSTYNGTAVTNTGPAATCVLS